MLPLLQNAALARFGIRMLQKFASTLAMHRSGILAYYDCPISTGPLEGTNTKIQLMKRQAYGHRAPRRQPRRRALLVRRVRGIGQVE